MCKKIVNFAFTIEFPTNKEPEKRIKSSDSIDDHMFTFPTNKTKNFNTVGKLENKKIVGIAGVSADLLKTSLPVNIFRSNVYLILSLSRGWFLKFLKDSKVFLLHKLGDIMNIN